MTQNITILFSYGKKRIEKMYSSKKKAWKYFTDQHDEVVQVLTDDAQDSGYKKLKPVRTYKIFARRLQDGDAVHFQCKLRNTGTHVMFTVQIYPVN